MTENFVLSTVKSAGQMFSRAVLDTSRTRIRTFGSDDAGHLVGGRFRQVTLDDSRLALVVGVIAPQLLKSPREAEVKASSKRRIRNKKQMREKN